MTSFAQAPSPAELLPAVAGPLARRGDRRRPDRAQPPVQQPAQQPALVPQVITVPTNIGGQTHASVNVAVAVSVQVTAQTTVQPAASTRRSKDEPKPVQDEWGFFDPNQCGFQALLARLDAIADDEDKD